MNTKHYTNDRSNREELIKRIGEGTVVKAFIVDRHHKNGKEVHMITDNGIIIIYKYVTKKLITKLIARPNQIRRYYEGVGKEAPTDIIAKAYEHQKLGYNKC